MEKIFQVNLYLVSLLLLAGSQLPANADAAFGLAQTPPPVILYSKAFADRLGLNPEQAVALDPGIEAITLSFSKRYGINISPKDPFVIRHHLLDLTPEETRIVGKHLAVFPVLFKLEKIPLFAHYDCNVGLYLNSSDPRLANARLPEQRLWDQKQQDDIKTYMTGPIDALQIQPVDTAGLKLSPGQPKPYTLYEYYQAYQGLALPIGALAPSAKVFTRQLATKKPTMFGLERYFVNFIPGMTYVELKVPACVDLTAPDNKGTLLWLFKQALPETETNLASAADYVSFQIPLQITQSAALKQVLPYSQDPLDNPFRLTLPAGFFPKN